MKLQPSDKLTRIQGEYKYVLVVGFDNDWAAYRGPVSTSTEEIATRGMKLYSKEAKSIFPDIPLRYRP